MGVFVNCFHKVPYFGTSLSVFRVGKAENTIWTSLEVEVWIFIIVDTILNLMQEGFLNKSFVMVALCEGEK